MQQQLTSKEYYRIAIPFILATVTQPLLSAADTAVVGHLSKPEYIAGVSVGATIFNTMYWLFGFLRVTTTGFVAQADAGEDEAERTLVFFRPMVIALIIGMLFILLQRVMFAASMWIIGPEAEVQLYAGQYYNILIYGAPVVLANYVILGWLMGKGLVRQSMVMQITGNLLNIVLDVLLVYRFHLAIIGVAAATLVSQLVSLAIGIYYLCRCQNFKRLSRKLLFDKRAFVQMILINMNMMIRTVCLLVQINMFAAVGAGMGTIVLSANSILTQIKSIFTYMFDGFANASSVYAGRAKGNRDQALLTQTMQITNKCTAALVIVITILFLLLRNQMVGLFTNNALVLETAHQYSGWLLIYPLCAGIGLTYYGIFTGVSATAPIRNSTAGALLVYLAVLFLTLERLGNHGLWLATYSFYLGMSVFLLLYVKALRKEVAAGH